MVCLAAQLHGFRTAYRVGRGVAGNNNLTKYKREKKSNEI